MARAPGHTSTNKAISLSDRPGLTGLAVKLILLVVRSQRYAVYAKMSSLLPLHDRPLYSTKVEHRPLHSTEFYRPLRSTAERPAASCKTTVTDPNAGPPPTVKPRGALAAGKEIKMDANASFRAAHHVSLFTLAWGTFQV
jgi:hypothetical protein